MGDSESVLLVPVFYMRWMQVAGLYPYPLEACRVPETPYSARSRPRLLVWSMIVQGAGIGFAVFAQCVLIVQYGPLLDELEFFTMLGFIYRSAAILQAVVTVFAMVRYGRHFPSLLNRARRVFEDCLPEHSARLLPFAWTWTTVWNLLYLAGIGFASFLVLAADEPHWDPALWLKIRPFYGLPDLYFVLHYALFALSQIIVATTHVLPQGLSLVLSACVRFCFANMIKLLKASGFAPADEKVSILKHARHQFAELQCLINKLNEIMSLVTLSCAVRDVSTWTALLGALMQSNGRPDESISREEVLIIRKLDNGLRQFIFVFGSLSLFNGVCRTLVNYIWCHDTVQGVVQTVQKLDAAKPDEAVTRECTRFLNMIHSTDGAMSAGGLFYMTRSFLTSFLGLLISFALLVYQTRDMKEDLIKLAEQEEFYHLTNSLLANLNGSQIDRSLYAE